MCTLIVRLVVLVFSFLAAGWVVAQEYEIDVEDSSVEHLYVTDPAKLDRFETVSVFITEGKPNARIADCFFQFADLIGRDNGATRVDVYDYKKYSEILARLNCRPVHAEEIPAVIFTAKQLKYCQVFPLSDPKALAEVLIMIQRNLSCPSDLAVERVAQETRRAVKELTNSVPQVRALQRPAGELIDFLAEQLRITCKRKQ